MKTILSISAAATALAVSAPATAQTDAELLQALEKEKEIITAKQELAQAKLDYLKVTLDRLPSFEGTATADAKTGQFESSVLSASALATVAQEMNQSIDQGSVLILAGDEEFAFGSPVAINSEMRALMLAVQRSDTCGEACHAEADGVATANSIATILTAVSAVAGLVRSDVALTTLSPDGVSDAKFAAILAASINGGGGDARTLGGNPGTVPDLSELDVFNDQGAWGDPTNIARKFAWLTEARSKAGLLLTKLNASKSSAKKNKTKIAKLDAWATQFDKFSARVSAFSDGKPSELGKAVDMEAVQSGLESVVRVYASAGGSLKKSKNIGTFFGGDPFRVTGGVRAHYRKFAVSNAGRAKLNDWAEYACASDHLRFKDTRGAAFSFSDSGTAGNSSPTSGTAGNSSRANRNICWLVADSKPK